MGYISLDGKNDSRYAFSKVLRHHQQHHIDPKNDRNNSIKGYRQQATLPSHPNTQVNFWHYERTAHVLFFGVFAFYMFIFLGIKSFAYIRIYLQMIGVFPCTWLRTKSMKNNVDFIT